MKCRLHSNSGVGLEQRQGECSHTGLRREPNATTKITYKDMDIYLQQPTHQQSISSKEVVVRTYTISKLLYRRLCHLGSFHQVDNLCKCSVTSNLMACMCMTPFILRVPSITESPILFAAGEDSPVIMLLLTGLAPHTAIPSAGTFAAGGTFSKSPL
ncbi:hypothetical protein BDL97_06G030800 [Sphagnum fallax]|nr:hypothetical protein BDL97_06G030800 [Sphagnum fallax]